MSSSVPPTWGFLRAEAGTAAPLGAASSSRRDRLKAGDGEEVMSGFSVPPFPFPPQMALWDLGPGPRERSLVHPTHAASLAVPTPTTATLWSSGTTLESCCWAGFLQGWCPHSTGWLS